MSKTPALQNGADKTDVGSVKSKSDEPQGNAVPEVGRGYLRVRRGLTPEEARREAVRVRQARERIAEARGHRQRGVAGA